ncbi:ABC transporter ATP-binding protein [Helcococcus kunzii]|uniref:ABC transporter ATP-binding protein n=1 Tax=Helcococcus kunzii TaxID=40091 RepID=UPI0024AE0C57|nr:ATP-binding cassette domain-containing protein [Helcococcus kunzii]
MKLELKNINKSFGKTQILHDVSFEVVSGKAMGFLGRNGAGKTTTIRTLMDVFRPDSGEFLLDGKPFNRNDYKIGYLPEERGMYQNIKLLDQLIYFGELKGMTAKDAKESAVKWLERLELSEYANKKLETLSKGNQQKIQILQAVINDPDIVVFDEPFSGLDPVNSMVLKDIINEFISKNRVVIFSSHQMSYVEEFCDDITFIKKGKIVLTGSLDEEKARLGKDKYLLITDENSRTTLDNIDEIISITQLKSGVILEVREGINSNDLLKALLDSNINVIKFEPYRPSLEEIFINLDREA